MAVAWESGARVLRSALRWASVYSSVQWENTTEQSLNSLVISGCPRIQLREDARPGTVWIPEPLDSVCLSLLSCLALPGWLQAPNSFEAISVAATEPLGAGTETVTYRKSGNTSQAAEVPRAMQSIKEVHLFSSVKCRNPITGASCPSRWQQELPTQSRIS